MVRLNRSGEPMKLTVTPIVIPFVVGIVAAATTSVDTWDTWRASLLPALSIIAAGVLVRLARGLPFTNADHFKLEQFREISKRLKAISRSLRMLAYVAISTMFALIVAKNVQGLAVEHLRPWASDSLGRTISFCLGTGVSYAIVRIVQVIEGDVTLLKLQSDVIDAVIARKNGEAFKASQAAAAAPLPIAGAENFGKTVL